MEKLALKIESIPFKSAYQGQSVEGYLFVDETVKPHAILQISHGMAEHIGRYTAFATFMASKGYIVCGNDHLGHGKTSSMGGSNGYFAPKSGRDYVLLDLVEMNNIVRERYPELPLILLGHSMGSFFARWFVEMYPLAMEGAIICGTGGKNPIGGVGLAITALFSKVKGPRYVSKFLDQLAFGSYHKRIKNPVTPSDWLSVDAENVQTYLADPKCGFPFTASAFHEMISVLQYVNSQRCIDNTPKGMPLYFIAGAEDPVGNYGAGPKEVAHRLQKLGASKVEVKIYPEMRHEILNETGRQQVWDDVLAWCERVLVE